MSEQQFENTKDVWIPSAQNYVQWMTPSVTSDYRVPQMTLSEEIMSLIREGATQGIDKGFLNRLEAVLAAHEHRYKIPALLKKSN